MGSSASRPSGESGSSVAPALAFGAGDNVESTNVSVSAPGAMAAAVRRVNEIKKTNPSNLAMKHFDESYFASLPADLQERFIACVRTGFENPDSGMGCYAMTPSDYDTFNAFFDPVIRDYHHAASGAVHITDWDASAVGDNGVLDVTKLGLRDLSMRVRVGRNLASFNLPGAMDRTERIAFEKTVVSAFEKLQSMPEYGGNVYSLSPDLDGEPNPNLISKEKYDQLVKAHVMFKDMDADPYLKSAGIASDWPYGRGCWQSDDGQCIIWFGEEDQLRIMCMKKGTKLNEVFDRLHKMLQVVESIDGIEFARSGKYGYVTSCPTNLGTGMRASVHIKIPNLTADGTDKKAKAVCKPLGLSVRGTGGEHTPIGADGTVDISPSARLFIKECDIIAALYTGIQNLMKEENAHVTCAGEEECKSAPVKPGEELARIAEIKASHPKNLAMKHFDESYFASLPADLQERFIACVRTGFENPDSGMGCYAMTPSDYDTFNAFFDPVIRDYHRALPTAVHITDWDASAVGDNGVLDVTKLGLRDLSMRVRVGRNLASFNLPGAMDRTERIAFEKTVVSAFEKLQSMPEYGGNVYSLSPDLDGEPNPNLISKEKYDQLVKAHVMFKDMDADPYLKSAGIASDWPYGRGCWQSDDGQCIIWFGEEDQLRIMCMKKGTKLNEVFDRLHKMLQVVESIDGIEFARSGKYGYVTSCPTNLGTGMRASVHIKIPNLTADGTEEQAKAVCTPLGLSVRGTGGEHTPIGADGTVDISPSARLFIKECDIIAALYTGIQNLMAQEKAAPKRPSATGCCTIQ